METVRPEDGMIIAHSVRLEPGVYVFPSGVEIAGSEIEVAAEGVTFIGEGRSGKGVSIKNSNAVFLHGITIANYYHGIHCQNCADLKIQNCKAFGTNEVPANTIFLDIWLSAEKAYGSGICVVDCRSSLLCENDFQHQMNGVLTYGCNSLTLRKNLCNYNSGFGIHIYETKDSVFEENSCDYCCRFEPRKGGLHHGHVGADAAGFLAVRNSSRNRFTRNTARLGGDGFFLAGLSPDGSPCGCNDNLFEENDASLSPNIAFESTFCEGNIYRGNFADRCGYGFWCGYSKNFIIESNRMLFNRQAGIAVENGIGFQVRGNQFQSNGHGILLWSRHVAEFEKAYPDRDTSRDWLIEENSFTRNRIGIRIAADQDHGIRNLDSSTAQKDPHSHVIRGNGIQDNNIGIELVRAHRNTIAGNTLNANCEANLRIQDSEDNEIANNIGSRGAYL